MYHQSSYAHKITKILFIVVVVLLLLFFYQPILNVFMEFLYKHPTSASWFASIQIEWLTRSLQGLFLMGFFGSLFFISLPTELVFIQYLDTSNHIIIIISVIVLANILAMILNYIIGFILGRTLLRLWLKDRFDSYQETVFYWGGPILLIGNILPSPIELVALVYGASKYPLRKYIYLVGIGRTVRYMILLYLMFSYPQIISFLIL